MCAVSVVSDFYRDKWFPKIPKVWPPSVTPTAIEPLQYTNELPRTFVVEISRAEFDALKQEVLDMKELIKRVQAYDAKTNQPHCESENKIALLREVAKAVGISLDDIFPEKA